MQVITKIREMQQTAERLRRDGKIIGFVPTMGYLHEGHLSLLRIARQKSDVTVMSIFVNPTQFGPNEDFDRYPRDFARDEKLAEANGCDIVFYPSIEEMYPQPYLTYVNVEKITTGLCGASRPGFFRGVTTVVTKLFNIVKPHLAVFGQKDAQQAIVVRQMVRDLNFDLEIVIAPIVREPDGLAMSSRNTYLSESERKEAVVLYKALMHAKKLIEAGERDAEFLKREMSKIINSAPSARIDYVAIVDAYQLRELLKLEGEVLIALAVWIGNTRLIDNLIITVS
ncbi:pantoate--beta-alanine ligase [candidate division KSB1 bacterium]|nr:pantoate--beta-alanine ligase [bacterium]OQX57182.1 MAG: pantoate--beta-alanine ligase [candidate division KSB1 bacterium 4484_219]RKY80085.1 MAG: pantoate--beta-alanine ligase [candidate division KSB1 bacterium]RKY87326.1 MAG: pantoate--beta-alanine ligase [candidate division KSB1 bacterium]